MEREVHFGNKLFAICANERAISRFLFYFLFTRDFKQQFKDRLSGIIGGVSLGKFRTIELSLPSLEEQQRIVEVLDEAFEGLERAHANTEANVQASHELFESELATVFKGIELHAERRPLGDAAIEFGRGRSRHRPRNDPRLYGGEVPFIQTGDVRNCDGYVLDYSQTYNDQGLAQSKLWPEGTVCITIAANIAETGILGIDACFPDSVIGMVCDQQATFPEYVEFMLRYFAVDLKAQGKGSAQDNINLAHSIRHPGMK